MHKVAPPEPLNLEESNLADAWGRWRQHFKVFSLASGISEKDEKVQAATLLHVAGPEALEVYNTFTWEDEGDKKKVNKILEKFEAYCIPRKNITWQRHLFNTHNQRGDKSFDQYLTDLKTKAQSCEFNDLKDGLIRDRIVCGIICDKTRSRLLREPDLTLHRAVEICRTNELTSAQMKSLSASGANSEQIGIEAIRKEDAKKKPCERCGGWHTKQQHCPAIGAECHKYGRKNHFVRVCRTKVNRTTLHSVQNQPTEEVDSMFIGVIHQNQKSNEWKDHTPQQAEGCFQD